MQNNEKSIAWPLIFGLLAILWIGVFITQSMSENPQTNSVAVDPVDSKLDQNEDSEFNPFQPFDRDAFLANSKNIGKRTPNSSSENQQQTYPYLPKKRSTQPDQSIAAQSGGDRPKSSYLDLVSKKTSKLLITKNDNNSSTIVATNKKNLQLSPSPRNSSEEKLLASNPLRDLLAKDDLLASNPLGQLLAQDGPFVPLQKSTPENPFSDLRHSIAKNNSDRKTNPASNLNSITHLAGHKKVVKATDSKKSIDKRDVKKNYDHLPLAFQYKGLVLPAKRHCSNTLIEILEIRKPEQPKDSSKKKQIEKQPGVHQKKPQLKSAFDLEFSQGNRTPKSNQEKKSNQLDLAKPKTNQQKEKPTQPILSKGRFANPESLLTCVREVRTIDERLFDWCELTETTLSRFPSLKTDLELNKIALETRDLVSFLDHWIDTRPFTDPVTPNRLRIVRDRLKRASDIWLAASVIGQASNTIHSSQVTTSAISINRSVADRQWQKYLLWDQASLIGRGLNQSQEKEISRSILDRYFNPQLNFRQAEVVKKAIPEATLRTLSRLSDQSIPASNVLELLEATEGSKAVDVLPSDSLNEVGRRLSVSGSKPKANLGSLLEDTYRQANLKVTISREFVNQWFLHQKWYANLLGKPTDRFVSAGDSPFRLDLVPCQNGIRLKLTPKTSNTINSEGWKPSSPSNNIPLGSISNGQKSTLTASNLEFHYTSIAGSHAFLKRSPFYLTNWLQHQYQTSQPATASSQPKAVMYRIGDEGVEVISPASSTNQALSGATSLGIKQKIGKARNYVQNYLGAFRTAGLEPKVMSASSEQSRIKTSFRIGDHRQQCGTKSTFVPNKDSVLDIQIHQSLVENILDRCELSGRQFTWQSFTQHLSTIAYGSATTSLIGDSDNGPDFRFELFHRRPIAVRFLQDGTKITLRAKKLWLPNHKTGMYQEFSNVQFSFYLNIHLDQWNTTWSIDPNRPVECHFYSWNNQAQGLSKKEVSDYSEKICTFLSSQLSNSFSADILPLKSIPNSLRDKLVILPTEQADGWLHLSIGKKKKKHSLRVFTSLQRPSAN